MAKLNLSVWLLAAILLFGIVAVATTDLTGAYYLGFKKQAKPISQPATQAKTASYAPAAACTDSDGGVNLGMAGTCTDIHGQAFTDTCDSASTVIEYICDDTDRVNKTRKGAGECGWYNSKVCPSGVCQNGACI